MSYKEKSSLSISGESVEKVAKITMIILACCSSFFALGFVWWKNKSDKDKKERIALSVKQKEDALKRLDFVMQSAARLRAKDTISVVYLHGTVVSVPASSDLPEIAAGKILENTKVTSNQFEKNSFVDGVLYCRFNDSVRAFIYDSEIQKLGKEEAIQMIVKNLQSDQKDQKVMKIFIPQL